MTIGDVHSVMPIGDLHWVMAVRDVQWGVTIGDVHWVMAIGDVLWVMPIGDKHCYKFNPWVKIERNQPCRSTDFIPVFFPRNIYII